MTPDIKAILDKLHLLATVMDGQDQRAAAAAFRTAMHVVKPNSVFDYEPL